MIEEEILARQAVLSPDGKSIVMMPLKLNSEALRRSYDFNGIVQRLVAGDDRIANSAYLLLSMPLKTMATKYPHLTVDDARMLARFHSVNILSRTRSQEVLAAMKEHTCTPICAGFLVAFKERSSQRPQTDPWRNSAVQPQWSMGSQSTHTDLEDPTVSTFTQLGANRHQFYAISLTPIERAIEGIYRRQPVDQFSRQYRHPDQTRIISSLFRQRTP
ncbi:hypothetical protein DFP72DRAFT_856467 [Ephemerocybe angulata]|uniref:Uncharacterized protein n=1 Tax=Ephemerocybe angulata TaxID=980116 RepID=A0A8H6HGU0_9AGAR|nr:hypothetical protein DFP72DRAFT_856467 [Tulosesus angulatus]